MYLRLFFPRELQDTTELHKPILRDLNLTLHLTDKSFKTWCSYSAIIIFFLYMLVYLHCTRMFSISSRRVLSGRCSAPIWSHRGPSSSVWARTLWGSEPVIKEHKLHQHLKELKQLNHCLNGLSLLLKSFVKFELLFLKQCKIFS